MRDDARMAHKPYSRHEEVRRWLTGLWPLLKAVGALLSPQERYYPEENCVKISAQSELWISGNLRNGETQNLGAQKQKDTKRETQSGGGSRPPAAMETMDQRGNPSPI